MHRQVGERAVVLGASMAGLLAAQVLSDGYGQVTVIDRVELPEASMHRRGVPHGRHLHALAARGHQALEELFSGLTAELVADGVPAGDMLADTRLFFSGHRLRRAPTGLGLLCASRPVLEGRVRARVRALPNVRLVDRCDVVGLATTPDRRRVTGARLLRRADGSAEEGSAPTWWWTPPAVAHAPRRGWRPSATAGPPRRRCVSGWAMPPGSTGCPPMPSAATWRSCRPPPPGIHGPGRSRCSRATGGW
jgi:hypothetical protein